ncbi:hypothetical protein FPZ43_15995 [Mucilaginibacter pallidiroseus]|uniref:Uncharacterized protein n=1 Tax=Mucilaginibacter pallidiroseus TaxID=2599295 RepID=A0A563U380_9SPHI|nr:hypothetical protein [Mucilaginibacter pallidiroseus]TWR25785.1 hypothetical protein FPZ43_15995 [Mucilaginibacter pallidiroseus]
MKALKVFAIAIIAMFTFQGAKAQVAINARIGAPAPVYRPRTVVVTRPVYHRPVRRMVYARPVYRRPVYRKVYVNRGYYRQPKRVVMVRHY